MFRAQYLANGWRYRFSYDGAHARWRHVTLQVLNNYAGFDHKWSWESSREKKKVNSYPFIFVWIPVNYNKTANINVKKLQFNPVLTGTCIEWHIENSTITFPWFVGHDVSLSQTWQKKFSKLNTDPSGCSVPWLSISENDDNVRCVTTVTCPSSQHRAANVGKRSSCVGCASWVT